MARNEQAIRVLKLLMLLSKNRRQGLSLEDIRVEFRISRRTVYRDIECLKYSGVDLRSVRHETTVRWVLINNPFDHEASKPAESL